MHISKHLLIALFSGAMLTSGLSAQRAESAERSGEATPSRTQGEHAAREGQQTRESATREGQKTREHAAAGRGEATRDAARHATPEQQRKLAAEIAHQETTHRGRVAKLKRLRQLAEQGGHAGRIKELEALQHKEFAAHKRKMSQLSSRLDPQERKVMERTVDRGREAKARTEAERRRALETWKKSHPGRSHGVDRRGHSKREAGHDNARGNTDRATGGQREHKSRDGGGGRDG